MVGIDYQKLFNELPVDVQNKLNSTDISEKIYDFGESINLIDNKVYLLAETIGDVVMGVIKEDDLFVALKSIGSDALSLGQIVNFSKKIISEIKNVPNITQQSTIQIPLQETIEKVMVSKPLQPEFKENISHPSAPRAEVAPGEIVHPAPFVLHEEKSLLVTQSTHQDLTTQRPTFYQPIFSSGKPRFEAYAKPKAATVEWGGKEIKKDLTTSLETSPQQIRVVHYSELKTEVDPFGGKPTVPINSAPATAPVVPISSVHPNNVVDLKDLPLG